MMGYPLPVLNGDLIAPRSTHGGLPALTRLFTRSPYTHSGIVVELQGTAWVAEWALSSLDSKILYDIGDLVRIALWNALHFKLPRTDRGGMVCSAYSAQIYRNAGWTPPPSMPSIPSPADLVRALGYAPRITAGDG